MARSVLFGQVFRRLSSLAYQKRSFFKAEWGLNTDIPRHASGSVQGIVKGGGSHVDHDHQRRRPNDHPWSWERPKVKKGMTQTFGRVCIKPKPWPRMKPKRRNGLISAPSRHFRSSDRLIAFDFFCFWGSHSNGKLFHKNPLKNTRCKPTGTCAWKSSELFSRNRQDMTVRRMLRSSYFSSRQVALEKTQKRR